MSKIKRGDIFSYDFGPQVDSRQAGLRPALIVQTDMLNDLDGYPLTVVVALSTKGRKSPTHVSIKPTKTNGLAQLSFAKCEQIYTVPKGNLMEKHGTLEPQDLRQVDEALVIVLQI